MSNSRIKILSPDFLSLIQPRDQGVMRAFKNLYKKIFIVNMLFDFENSNNGISKCVVRINAAKITDAICFAHSTQNSV